ncbi:MAG: hypothetical protein AB7N65_25555 [Vicinamibacterales bacterium]
MSWSSLDAAQRAAIQFARRHAVDVWVQTHEHVTRVASYRPLA